MSKDPAFLFYSSDFLTGTLFMTNEQVGKYIKLLCMQHQQGHLLEEDMLNICKTYDKKIFEKFAKDNNGKFYNKRLEEESIKRKQYSESRRSNRMGKKDMSNISTTYEEHMENENEDINKDINKDIKLEAKSLQDRQTEFMTELEIYINDYAKEILMAFWEYWSEPNVSKTKMKKELQKTWDTKRRLNTWNRNQNNWGKSGKTRQGIDESELREAARIIANDPDLK